MLKTEMLVTISKSRQNQKNTNKMKTLGKLKLKAEKMLSHEDLVSFRGGSGSGTTQLQYCRDSYMIRSCNNLSGGAMTGWSVGWGSNGCSQYGGAALWSSNMGSGCDTSWYSY
jgi:hypothetical protein